MWRAHLPRARGSRGVGLRMRAPLGRWRATQDAPRLQQAHFQDGLDVPRRLIFPSKVYPRPQRLLWASYWSRRLPLAYPPKHELDVPGLSGRDPPHYNCISFKMQ